MSSEEERLVREAISGNQAAFSRLYGEHFDKVYRYVYFRVSVRSEAEDITQEVFLKALQSIGSFKWREVPFAAWLFRIAHNMVIDHMRKQSKRKVVPLEEAWAVSTEDPVAITEQRFEMADLAAALKRLPPAQQEVISLRFMAEMPIAEVARTLKKSEGTVKALQFNGTVTLRRIFSGEGNV